MTLAIGLALAPMAQAATTPVMVVTATRFQTTIDTAPVNTTIITAEQIKASNAATLSQMLAQQAGIQISDLFGITGSKASADMGGFGATAGQNTLVLLNGRRLNELDLSGADLTTVPLASIAQVEIIHGSSAVLYGDNAVSGVINIVTRNGDGQSGGNVSIKAGSFRTRGLDLNYSTPLDTSVAYVAANTLRSDGYRDKNDFIQKNLVAEVTHADEEFTYGFRFNGNYEDMMLPGALNEPLFYNDPRSPGTGAGEWAHQNRNAVEAYISAEHYAAEFNVGNKHSLFGATTADLSSWSITPRQKRTIDGHELIAGLDLYYSALDTLADFNAPNINRSATTHTSYAAYATDSYKLGSASSLSLGLRRQWVGVEIQNSNLSSGVKTIAQQDDAVTAWDIGLNHQFNSTMRGYLRWAESFRLAVLDEMWSYFSGAANPLKPQTGHHVEAGGAIAVAEGTSLDINLFRMTLNNEIGFDSTTLSNINFADPTRHQGANVNLRHQVNALWQTGLGYGWRNAIFTAGANEGKAIPQIPSHKLSLTNNIKLNDRDQLSANAIYTSKRYFGDDFANSGKEMPSQTLVDLGYSHTVNGWTTQFRINNLTGIKRADSGYYVSSSANPYYYYPLPGRAYYLTVSTGF